MKSREKLLLYHKMLVEDELKKNLNLLKSKIIFVLFTDKLIDFEKDLNLSENNIVFHHPNQTLIFYKNVDIVQIVCILLFRFLNIVQKICITENIIIFCLCEYYSNCGKFLKKCFCKFHLENDYSHILFENNNFHKEINFYFYC